MEDQQSALAMPREGVDARLDLLLAAVERGVRAEGFENVTIEGVAALAGVSRATMYRRFGSREGMLRAHLLRRTSRMIEIGRDIAAGPGEVGARLEDILTFMVLGVDRAPWVKRAPSGIDNDLVQAAALRFFATVVAPMLSQAEKQGRWRAPAPIGEMARWLTDQYFLLVRLRGHEEAEVRRYIRTYILPAVDPRAFAPDSDALAERVEALQRELSSLVETLRARPERAPASRS